MNFTKVRIDKSILFCCFMFIVMSIIALRTVFEIAIPVQSILLLSLIFACLAHKKYIIAYAICCIPLSVAFQFKYYLLISICAILIKNGRRIKINKALVTIAIMMVWELLHAFSGTFSIIEYLRGFAELLFLAVIVNIERSSIDTKLIIRSLTACVLFICTVIFVMQMQKSEWNLNFLISGFRLGSGNQTMKNFSLSVNPNRLGFMCNLAISGLTILYKKNEATRKDYFAIFCLIMFGIMTVSRTFVVGMLVIFLLFILTNENSIRNKIKTLLYPSIICGISIFTFSNLFPDIMGFFLHRFQEADITNGRATLFLFYNEHIWSTVPYMIFGVGLQDYTAKLERVYGYEIYACHNGYQELWVVWGIVGLCLFLLLILYLIKSARLQNMVQNRAQYIPLALVLIVAAAGQLISSEVMLLALAFSYACMCDSRWK